MSATDRLPVIPIDNLVPCCGFFCCFHSLLTANFCSGCYGRITIPCILMEQSVCRPIENDPIYCCICSKSECLLGYTPVCCQLETQCCCWDWRCSLPQRENHPCILNILFINCCYKFKGNCTCCESVRQLEVYYQRKYPSSDTTTPLNSSGPANQNQVLRTAATASATTNNVAADGEAVAIFTTEAFPVETNVLADARLDR